MNFFIKRRVSFWIILFLLFTNIATISTIVYHRYKYKNSSRIHNPQCRLKEFVKSDLNFSIEQQKRLDSVKNILRTKRKIILENISKAQHSLFKELATTTSNEIVLDSLNIMISRYTGEMSKLALHQFVAVKGICNESQKQKLAVFFKSMQADIEKDMNEMKNKLQND